MIKKYLIVSLGWLIMVVAIAGIFIPGVPVTPLMMLSAWLFARSSRRFYIFIHRNKITGKYLNNYRRKGGMTKKMKLVAIALMSAMITISVVLFIWPKPISWIVMGSGLIGILVVIFAVPNAKERS